MESVSNEHIIKSRRPKRVTVRMITLEIAGIVIEHKRMNSRQTDEQQIKELKDKYGLITEDGKMWEIFVTRGSNVNKSMTNYSRVENVAA